MVLSRLTKITGPGISTDTNWVGDNANYTGIVTANSFVGDGSELVGVASTDNIITGTPATFNTYPVSMNAGINVTGVATFAGNVSIGGTLTYEDVTNIDSVGIITARNDIKVGTGVTITPAGAGFFSGIVTATSFTGDGANITGVAVTEAPVLSYEIFGPNNNQYFWWGGGVDNTIANPDLFLQRGQTYRFVNNAGSAHPLEIRYAQAGPEFTDGVRGDKTAVQLFTVPYSAPAKLRYQCVPHTNMGGAIYIRGASGNQEKVGLTTFRNAINIQSDDSSPGRIRFYCEVNNIHYVTLKAPAHANFSGYPVVTLPNITGTLLTSNNANISGIVTATGADINGDLDVDGHTNLDNVSVAGVTTHQGLFKLPDSTNNQTGRLMLGTGTDLQIFHTGSAGEIGNFTGNLNIKTNSFRLFNGGANQLYIKADQNDSVVLYHSNNEKFRTTNTGSVVTGILTATSFEGDGSNLTGITGTTINNNADNRVITGSGTANTLNAESGLTFDGTNLDIDSDSGHLRIGADQDLDLYHNGSNGYLKNSTGQQLYRSETHTFENAAGSTEYLRINANGMIEMRSDMSSSGQENKNIFRFTDTDAGTGGNQSMGRLQWFSSDTSGNGACVKAEIEALASDTTPDGYMVFKTHNTGTTPTERLRITSGGRFGFNRSTPQYAMHLSPETGQSRIDLHMTNDTTGHNAGDGVQFGYQNGAGAYIWNFENTPIYFGNNNTKKFEIHATGSTQIYDGDLLIGPDSVSQMEATIRAWGCSLWYTTIDSDYFHDSGGEYRQFYNKGEKSGSYYLTAYNCPIQTGVGPQNRNFWRGAQNDTRAEGNVGVSVGYRGAFFFISRTSCSTIRSNDGAGKYLYDSNSPTRVSVSFDSFGNNMDRQELSFHCGSSAGYNSGDATVGGRLGSSASDSTLRMYAVGVNMQNYNAPNNKKAGNHLGISVINEDGTDYTANTASRLSENLINNGTTGSTNVGSNSGTEFNWGTRHSNDRGYNSNMQFSQIMYFDDVQLNSSQWDYLEHYFKVMYG